MWTARASLALLTSLLAIGAGVICPDLSIAAAPPGPQDALHQVMPGDDLHLIAGYYYGDARQWERIWQANKAQIRNPNLIERGALLRVPDAAAPDQPYPDFVARTRPSAMPTVGPLQAGVPPAPEVEVRIMGEERPSQETPEEAPAPTPRSAAPEASAPPRVVGTPGTLPPRPIQVPQPGRTGQEGR
jgi:hypothetical protein